MPPPLAPRTPLALIAAGGEGKRLGASGPKALVRCAARSLLAWSLDGVRGSALVRATAGGWSWPPTRPISPHSRSRSIRSRAAGLDVVVCAGGPSRSHSVRNALTRPAI